MKMQFQVIHSCFVVQVYDGHTHSQMGMADILQYPGAVHSFGDCWQKTNEAAQSAPSKVAFGIDDYGSVTVFGRYTLLPSMFGNWSC